MRLRLRSFSCKDLYQCASLVRSAWYLNDDGPMRYKLMLAARYFISCLKDSNLCFVAAEGKKVHALVLLVGHYNKDKASWLKAAFLDPVLKLLDFSCKRLSYLSSDYAYDEKYKEQYAYMHDIVLQNKIKGCELLLIISDKEVRGLGRHLIRVCERLALKHHEPCIYLLTDESCNYTFYQRHNYTACFEQELDFSIAGEQRHIQKCFIYKKDLKV